MLLKQHGAFFVVVVIMYDLIKWADRLWLKEKNRSKINLPRFNNRMGVHTNEVYRSTEEQEINKLSRAKRYSDRKLSGY